jgi:phosphate transport system protein
MTSARHTDREYEAQLDTLRERVLTMGARVEEMIGQSIRALLDRNSALAREVIENDRRIDRLEVEMDRLCLSILARRQPVASDLRFIATVLKIVRDIERIADLAVNVAERVIELNTEAPLKPYVDLPRMAESARGMVRDALNALVAGDAVKARDVIGRDPTVDAYYSQIFRELLTYMMEDPRNIYRATRVQSVAKYLERIADHATNIAEMVIFNVAGEDIRHSKETDELTAAVAPPRGVLFLCVGNSARSQMAEGWARKLLPEGVNVWSAGSRPAAEVNPNAVRVMAEAGVDIASHRPKPIEAVALADIDLVVTLCAEEECPVLPGRFRREHWEFPDPAGFPGSESEVLESFRRIRDEIKACVAALAG